MKVPKRLLRAVLSWATALSVTALLTPGMAMAASAHHHRRPTVSQATSAYPQPPYELWTRFSEPKTIEVVNLEGSSSNAMLAAVTMQGAYNQQQRPTRIYTIQTPGDQVWLQRAIPKNIHVVTLNNTTSGPHAGLITMLQHFGKDIKGVIVADPNISASIDVATTMAGIDDAMVVMPSDLSLVESYHLPVLANLNNYGWTNNTEAESWAVTHLLSKTSKQLVIELDPTIMGDLRDYAVASKAFVFWLHIESNFADLPLFQTILKHTPPDTPIMGYIPDEAPDVAALSELGHFLNASDYLSNESIWASLPSPASLHQPPAEAVKAQPGTVYVAFMVSDGDNSQYVEHRMRQVWSDGYLGKVPEGWTMPPGMIDFAPTIMEWYYHNLPKDNDIVTGPSGIGYATAMSGQNLTEFGKITHAFLVRDDIPVVDYWGVAQALKPFAEAAHPVAISYWNPMPYENVDGTAIYGQTSGYISSLSSLVATIETQAAKAPKNQPTFLSPLVDAWALSPHDIYVAAEELASQGAQTGTHYVFVTPGVLAKTMEDYYAHKEAKLPLYNAQAVPASNYLPGHGVNLVKNPSGGFLLLTTGWSILHPSNLSYALSLTYKGESTLYWNSATKGTDAISYYPGMQPGASYVVSADLAGSGVVDLAVWNGSEFVNSKPIHLTKNYQFVRLAVSIPSSAPSGTSGLAPYIEILKPATSAHVKVYFRNVSAIETLASTSTSTAPTNLVLNPSGANGLTTGWDMAYSGEDAKLSTTTVNGAPALQWTVSSAIGHSDWVSYYPDVKDGETYTFSVTLSGSGQAELNVWSGTQNLPSKLITLSKTPVTESLTVTIPSSAPGGQAGPAPQLQVVTPGTANAVVDIQNASVVPYTSTSTAPTNLVTNPSGQNGLTTGWDMAYSGEDATLGTTTVDGQPALQWTVNKAFGQLDWVSYYPDVTNGKTYTFSVDLSGSGQAQLNVWTGTQNIPAPMITLTKTPQEQSITVTIPDNAPGGQTASAPQLQVRTPGTANATVDIQNASVVLFSPPNLVTNPSGQNGLTTGWDMAYSGADATLGTTTVNGQSALQWTVSSAIGHSDWVSYYPNVTNGDTYTFSVTLSGSGQAQLNVWTGTQNVSAPLITLSSTPQTQTLTETIPANAPTGQTGSAPQLQVVTPGTANATVDIQDASVMLAPSSSGSASSSSSTSSSQSSS
jgi:hypothetical protein